MRLELPVLLSAGFCEIVRIIFGPDDDFASRVDNEVGDIETERRISTLVFPYAGAVDPDRCAPVDGAEMQHPTLSGHALRQFPSLAVPAGPEESGMTDAARGCFRREWNVDLFTPVDLATLTPNAIRVEGEIPRPVEGVPVRSLKLRPRVPAAAVIELLGSQRRNNHESEHRCEEWRDASGAQRHGQRNHQLVTVWYGQRMKRSFVCSAQSPAFRRARPRR